MIFNKEKNVAFVLPTKTGTQTIKYFLGEIGWTALPNRKTHNYTDQLINEYPNLSNYTVYGFLRNPLLRFESAVLHMKRVLVGYEELRNVFQKQVLPESMETASYDSIVDVFPAVIATIPNFFDPQVKWLAHPKVTVLDFDNLEAELRRISGDTTTPIVSQNVATSYGKSVVTQKVIDFVRQEYAADYALAKDRLGKEYNP